MDEAEKRYIEVVKGLISGSYRFATGTPDSRDIEEATLEEVRNRLPNLKHLDDDELSQLVSDAINHAMDKLCHIAEYSSRWGKRQAYYNVETPGYSREFGWMRCSHPEIGEFHIVFDEENSYDAGVFHYGYMLTKNERQAKSEFMDVKRELKQSVVV